MSFVQKIFYGPPGTGKTWKAAREAVRVVDPDAYQRALDSANRETEMAKEHQRLVADGRIVWVTFHASYSYEDFVEGYRPSVDKRGRLTYIPVDGHFKQLCSGVRSEIDLKIGELLPDARGKMTARVFDKDSGGWLIRITPDRTDSVAPEQYKYVSKLILNRFINADLPPEVFSIPGSALVDLRLYGIDPDDSTLPPPDMAKQETHETREGSTVRRIVAARAQVSSTDLTNSAHYGAVYRRLKELRAHHIDAPVAMVIDEINRADVARVFGDLFTLLDYDKRTGMEQARTITLQYSKAPFTIPSNVSVIGTMNTVDRSVTAIDFAMRRRFEFELVDVNPTKCPADYGGINLQNVLKVINQRISVLLGPDYRIGHAQFMEVTLNATCTRLGWPLDPAASKLRAIAHGWRTYVIPMLLEYFHTDWRKARAVAGFVRTQRHSYELFNSVQADDWLLEELADERELAGPKSFEIASWWDPSGPDWNETDFRGFLTAYTTKFLAALAVSG